MKEKLNIDNKKISSAREKKEEVIETLLSKGKPLDVDDDTRDRLVSEIKDEFEAIKAERKDIHGQDYDDFLETMDRQKRGRMPKTAGRAYNLDTGLSRVKCGDIVRSIISALFEVDPKISVNPRPGFAKTAGREICQEQEEFLDYSLDEKIPLRKPLTLAADSAVYKKVGIIKWTHKVVKEPKIIHEVFQGSPEAVINSKTGQISIKNKGLEEFILSYGDAIEKDKKENPGSAKYDWIIKALQEGKKVEFDSEYQEVTYSDPFPQFIDNKDFYIRKSVDGYMDMCKTRLIVERMSFDYYTLRQFEKDYGFVNVDKLIYDSDEDRQAGRKRERYATENYNILCCVYYAKISQDDDDYTKTICFLSEKEMLYLGGIYYPYTVLECYYVPHYVKITDNGFYQEGVAEDITDVHLAGNAILNHTLEAAHMANTITPIADESSPVVKQFLENGWTNGFPIKGNPKEVGFLNNLIKPPDVASLLVLYQQIERIGGNLSRVSDLRSGRETPLDPDAPGNKTAMLLQETGRGVKDFVDVFKEGFNIDAQVILKMYYEMGQDEQEYVERRQRGVTGAVPKKISKAAMIARTSIQSQAMAYDFNKMNAKREDLAINAFLTNESMIINNPGANYERIRLIMSSWSPKWKNAIDKILPSIEEFKAQQSKIALMATQQYIQGKIAESQMTGQPPQMVPEELIGMINKLQSMATMPMDKAVALQKQENKGEKG